MDLTPEQRDETKRKIDAEATEVIGSLQDKDRLAAALKGLTLSTDFERYLSFEKIYAPLHQELRRTLAEAKDDVEKIESILNTIAELAKTETLRPKMAQSALISDIYPLLEWGQPRLITPLLRVFANYVAQSEENCDELVGKGFVEKALEMVKGGDEANVRNASAVISNLASGSSDVQEMILNANGMELFMSLLSPSYQPDTLKMVSFAVLSLLEEDRGISEFLRLQGIDKIIQLAKHQDSAIQHLAVHALEILAAEDRLKRALFQSNAVAFLLSVVNSGVSEVQRRGAAKTIALILSDDDNMSDFFTEEHVEGIKKWLDDSDLLVRAHAAVCIGNMARKDEFCTKMVEHGLSQSLITLLKGHDQKEKHSAIGAIRNLCIPAQNKTAMGQSGLLEEIKVIFDADSLALKFSAIIVLKILITKNEENARKMFALGLGAQLNPICLSTEHEGVQCEGARIMVQVAYLNNEELLDEIYKAQGLPLLDILLQSKHQLLKKEGIETALLFSKPEHVEEIWSKSASSILSLAKGTDDEPLSKSALSFLRKLTKERLSEARVAEALSRVKECPNETLKTTAEELLQQAS